MLKFKSLNRTPPDSVYTQPETGFQVRWETSIDDVFDKITTHRHAHRIQLTEGWQDEVLHQLAMTLKAVPWEDWCYDPDKPHIPRLAAYGQALWKELHEYALAYPEKPDDYEQQAALGWFAGWVSRIPRAMNCDCAANWRRLNLGSPDVSSRANFYQWTVMAHDRVREKLGQERMEGAFRTEASALPSKLLAGVV
jgi:hypothetical protein